MRSPDTLFRCVLERAVEDGRERRVFEVWALWPGTARELAGRKLGGWTVIGVEADFRRAAPSGTLSDKGSD